MFRIRDPQENLWQSQFLVTPKKAKRLDREVGPRFSETSALPLIDEERFAPMYCVDIHEPSQPGGADRPRGPPPQRDVQPHRRMKLWNN